MGRPGIYGQLVEAESWDPHYREIGNQIMITGPGSMYRRRDEDDVLAAGAAEKAAVINPEHSGNSAWGSFLVEQAFGDKRIPDYSDISRITREVAGTVDPDKIAVAEAIWAFREQ